MKIRYNPIATKAFAEAPSQIQKAFLKQAGFLIQNLHPPSLRAKKYDEANDRWQGRVNKAWRFYFAIEDDTYVILDIIPPSQIAQPPGGLRRLQERTITPHRLDTARQHYAPRTRSEEHTSELQSP